MPPTFEAFPTPRRTAAPVADLELPAIRDNVPQLRRAMVQAARASGVSPVGCQHVALAVSEAAANAVLHAFTGTPGRMRAAVWAGDGEIEVLVADDGRGLALRDDSPGLGMGLGLMAKVSDRMEIDSALGRGTSIRLWFTRT